MGIRRDRMSLAILFNGRQTPFIRRSARDEHQLRAQPAVQTGIAGADLTKNAQPKLGAFRVTNQDLCCGRSFRANYFAGWSFDACSSSSMVDRSSLDAAWVASSADFKFTALILPRLSCSRS